MTKRRVVITGLGLLSPLGLDVNQNWNNLLEGQNGIKNITRFDATDFSVRFAGEVDNFDFSKFASKKEVKKMDLFIQYGIAAGIEALKDSGIKITDENKTRCGVAVGSGIGGIPYIEKTHDTYKKSGSKRISPFFIPATIINMVAGNLSIMYNLQGPNISIVTACTTGLHNIGHAARMIAYNDADVMVAGGAESTITPLAIGGFAAARALSTNNENPQKASCPWDKNRDGFVMGEGAGVLVLEEYELAKQRGAKIYAELVGFGMSADAYHMTTPALNGEGGARAMQNALDDASASYKEISYINAHGTSTPAGDLAETNGIKSVFKEHSKDLFISSTKSMMGHLLGAAGSAETIILAKALQTNRIPPTINIENQDELCDLDYVKDTARDIKNFNYGLTNSFGFGGTNGSLLLKKI